MDKQEFRKFGHDFIDWIADYLENIASYPVVPAIKPGGIRLRLQAHAPEQGELTAKILDIERKNRADLQVLFSKNRNISPAFNFRFRAIR
jgi:hypothetical protein